MLSSLKGEAHQAFLLEYFIFEVKAARWFEASGTTHPATRCPILEGLTSVPVKASIRFNIKCRNRKNIQGVPGGKDNILRGHSIGHSKQKTLYEHVSYSERFPR
jgi:hypothetical protein